MSGPVRELESRARSGVEQELDLVRSAILLVAAGGSRRVSVGTLYYGEQLLPQAERIAREQGVELRSVAQPDALGLQIVVEEIA